MRLDVLSVLLAQGFGQSILLTQGRFIGLQSRCVDFDSKDAPYRIGRVSLHVPGILRGADHMVVCQRPTNAGLKELHHEFAAGRIDSIDFRLRRQGAPKAEQAQQHA